MKTLAEVPWRDFGGSDFTPTQDQIEQVSKFLKDWGVPVVWLTYIAVDDEDDNLFFVHADHPSVPEDVNGFRLVNDNPDDPSHADWRWDVGC